MKKFLLLSDARQGTTFLLDTIASSTIYTCYELMHTNISFLQKEHLFDCFKHYITDAERESLSNCRYEDEKEYFLKVVKILETVATTENCNLCGFKIFPSHLFPNPNIKNRIDKLDIINLFDKFIFLERNDIEVAYSRVKAEEFGYKVSERHQTKQFILTPKIINSINKARDNRHKFFEEFKELLQANNRDFITINYDDLSNLQDTLSTYLEETVTYKIPFEKNVYDYKTFIRDNPEIIS